MAKKVLEEESEPEVEEMQKTQPTSGEREIIVTVKDDGSYALGFNGQFNVVELYAIVNNLNGKIGADYRQFMEQLLFGMLQEKK